jgi:hypothetical protein
MKKIYKIAFFALLLIFPATYCFSQTAAVTADTTRKMMQKNETSENQQNQVQTQTREQSQNQGTEQGQVKNQNAGAGAKANAGAGAGAKGAGSVKQVKSARPDWSKAKGARPNIVRPGGSALPKGAGKPGGAGRPGGR